MYFVFMGISVFVCVFMILLLCESIIMCVRLLSVFAIVSMRIFFCMCNCVLFVRLCFC